MGIRKKVITNSFTYHISQSSANGAGCCIFIQYSSLNRGRGLMFPWYVTIFATWPNWGRVTTPELSLFAKYRPWDRIEYTVVIKQAFELRFIISNNWAIVRALTAIPIFSNISLLKPKLKSILFVLVLKYFRYSTVRNEDVAKTENEEREKWKIETKHNFNHVSTVTSLHLLCFAPIFHFIVPGACSPFPDSRSSF